MAEVMYHGTMHWVTGTPANVNGKRIDIFYSVRKTLDDPDEGIVEMARYVILKSLQDYISVVSSRTMGVSEKAATAYDVMEFFNSDFYELLAGIVPELKLNERRKECIIKNMDEIYSNYCPFWRRQSC